MKDVFRRKHRKEENKNVDQSKEMRGKYIKYPISYAIKVNKGLSAETLCDICESGDCARTLCVECQQKLCSVCTLRHRNMRSSVSHHLIGQYSEYGLKEGVALCLKHPKQEKSLFCLKCSEEICIYCKLIHHMEHATKDLVDATYQKSTTESRRPDEMAETIYHKTQKETCSVDMLTLQPYPENLIVNATRSSDVLIRSTETGKNLKYLRCGVRGVDYESDGDTLSVDSGSITCSNICHPFF